MRRVLAISLVALSPWVTGFDLSKHAIPPSQILSGGPPKDGIPAILEPEFVAADDAGQISGHELVIGVADGQTAKAYPLRILNWHEIVNDRIGDRPVAVTYCPLTASGIVYEREVAGRELTFGVSGKLYQSNVLLYDKATESLWSQLAERAVTGEWMGTKLRAIPSTLTTWAYWRLRHPSTLVLSERTGHRRPYSKDPYREYHRSGEVMFPVSRTDGRLEPKEMVLGVTIGDTEVAFSFSRLALATKPVALEVEGSRLEVQYDETSRTAEASVDGAPLAAFTGYWFAWYAFHPDTAVWEPPGEGTGRNGGAEINRRGSSEDPLSARFTNRFLG